MAVRVLLDHGVEEGKIVFVTVQAGLRGVARLLSVFADVRVMIAGWGEDEEERWVEQKYLGC
jgi:uridine kinase